VRLDLHVFSPRECHALHAHRSREAVVVMWIHRLWRACWGNESARPQWVASSMSSTEMPSSSRSTLDGFRVRAEHGGRLL
jgi:hypothetical protein